MLIRRLPSLPSWKSAYRELDEARREMERVFDSLTGFTGTRTAGVFPAINVSETGETLLVRAELPGIKPDDLDVTVENDTLTLAGKREIQVEEKDASYHRREREWGSFRRSFSLPVRIDANDIQARYVNGILTVELPKAAEAKPRQISVQTGA
jgi:HSP20 family protein